MVRLWMRRGAEFSIQAIDFQCHVAFRNPLFHEGKFSLSRAAFAAEKLACPQH
jgi:hypothetical protein